jgi:hypothetical protein
MNPLAQIGALAIACAVAFGAGLYTKDKFFQAAQVTAVKHEVAAVAKEVPQSIAASNQIQATADTQKAAVETVKEAVNARLAQPPKVTNHVNAQGAASEVQSLPAGDQPMPFDLDTVRLLNAARRGIAVSAASGSDAEVASAPAAAGGPYPDGQGVH